VHPAHGVFLRELHPLIWLAWVVYWVISARGIKPAVRRETAGQRWAHSLPLMLAMMLFIDPRFAPRLAQPFWHHGHWGYGIGTALLIAGLAFSIWARRTLGRNWSGTVTVKQDHELIETGPYRFVRHPIYTGLLLALAGSTLAQGLWGSVLAWALCLVSFLIKLRREEAWMRETFGEKYAAYCARTKRLVPWVL
jgi:protein-S-isoprenylcysteine O-methyltransferase Ste14